jgi:nucleotide-binding universal stress UspA family protein
MTMIVGSAIVPIFVAQRWFTPHHALVPSGADERQPGTPSEEAEDARRSELALLARIAGYQAVEAGIDAHVRIVRGSAGAAIARRAGEAGADLVVIGRRSRDVGTPVRGSLAHRVARRARCPVMIVS